MDSTINGWRDKFSIAEEALANAQHHDAATGTCSDQVAENYKHALFAGYSGAGEVGAHIMKLIAKELFNQELSFKFCDNIDSTIDNCAALKDLSPTKVSTQYLDIYIYIYLYIYIYILSYIQIFLPFFINIYIYLECHIGNV